MSLAASGPGKTAPKILHDFLVFDPLKVERNQNVLIDHPPPVGEGPQLSATGQIGACRHEYALKHQQSLVPPLDHRPDSNTVYKTAVICKKCRLHADVRLSYEHTSDPCPTADCPLHHFQRLQQQDAPTHERIRYAWQCSALDCRAQLRISFRLARLKPEERNLVANPEFLKRRYEDVLRETPQREDVRQVSPIEALGRLRRYLLDSLDPNRTTRTFSANQKRFNEVFGVLGRDCSELLQKLGFLYQDDTWTLPNPPVLDEQARRNAEGRSAREYIEDVVVELLAWMYTLSAETNVPNPAASESWVSAENDIRRTLSAQGYSICPLPRRAATTRPDLVYYFSSLGALPDFSDELVEFAFERQILCDVLLRGYYYECLQVIADQRGTERLQLKIAMLASQEYVSRKDLAAAYRLLNVPMAEAHNLSDERILDLFGVRQSDLGAHAQGEARQALNKIGLARGSTRLINASQQMIETYEDALTWLGNGVTRDTTDEALVAVVGSKVADSPSNEEIAQKAISVIAKARDSSYLNNWLATGQTEGYQMGSDEALRYLGIEDNLDALDKTILPAVFDSARADRPGEQTEKAIAVLQKAISGTAPPLRDPLTWPVGLRSHGNTCYLNSLLQYYFSIQPLRDIILNYEKYALDTSKVTVKQERVGQRKISMVEIKGGQRFAADLRDLFERMIKEPGESVMPEEALVCRAFLEPKDYELLTPSLPSASKLAASAPANSTSKEASESLTNLQPGEPDKGAESDASSVTLQGSNSDGYDSKTTIQPSATLLTPPGSPTEPAVQGSEPDRAPPLPPRRFSTTKEEALTKAESNARQQQDVTEVHDGVMFRLRSGMTPDGMDDREEQYDALRSLFSIALAEIPVKNDMEGKTKTLLDSSLQLNVPNEAKDIYTALDEIFDLQAYDENAELETYKSIVKMPPLLQINIPRIGFDNVRGAFKSNACIKLVEELYLDRYIDDPEILPLRRKCWAIRKQLHALRKEQHVLSKTATDLDGPSAIGHAANYLNSLEGINSELHSAGLSSIDFDHQLPSILAQEAREQAKRLARIDQEATNLKSEVPSFSDFKRVKYRLAAVFFHRGDYGHGHYWIYIYDFGQEIWRKYNDEHVEEFPSSKIAEILEATEWSHGTPTYAVYVQDENKDAIVHPVCRVPPPTTSHDQDAIMDGNDTQDSAARPSTGAPAAKSLTTEGTEGSWDEPREIVKDAKW